jgi:hypothetical protein
LDWTSNPLYAAFFAASDASAYDVAQIDVWAVHRDDLEPPEWEWRMSVGAGRESFGHVPPGWRIVSYPRHQSAFMHAQSGVFTYFSNAGHYYVVHGRWPDMEATGQPASHRKLTLPKEQIPELLRLLRAEGISKAHLMPHLDNISDALIADWNATLASLKRIIGSCDSPES